MVRESCGYEIPIILVGNKTDSKPREVNFETAENVSVEFNLFYIEVSAKTGVNIEETFSVLTEQLMQQIDLHSTSLSSPSTSSASILPTISPQRSGPPARITTREQVPRKRIGKNPETISLKQGDENDNTPPAGRPGAKKRSCCSWIATSLLNNCSSKLWNRTFPLLTPMVNPLFETSSKTGLSINLVCSSHGYSKKRQQCRRAKLRRRIRWLLLRCRTMLFFLHLHFLYSDAR